MTYIVVVHFGTNVIYIVVETSEQPQTTSAVQAFKRAVAAHILKD